MSYLKGPKRTKFDNQPGEMSPLDVAGNKSSSEILAMVQEALNQRRMRLAFQPAVYASDPSLIGFYEGFMRVLDVKGHIIPAAAFMPVVEQRELGREIDCAALQMGLMTLDRNPGIRVAVNMSARSIGYRKWEMILRQALRQKPKVAQGLILEINEASAVQMPDVLLPFMAEMRDTGIIFSLDDFGAGLTSLSLLRDFEFEMAKIDGQFIRHIDKTPDNQTIVRSAVALGKEFDMFMVAEAVETEAEAKYLRNLGIGCMQGYLFGAPTVSPDFTAFRKGRDSA